MLQFKTNTWYEDNVGEKSAIILEEVNNFLILVRWDRGGIIDKSFYFYGNLESARKLVDVFFSSEEPEEKEFINRGIEERCF